MLHVLRGKDLENSCFFCLSCDHASLGTLLRPGVQKTVTDIIELPDRLSKGTIRASVGPVKVCGVKLSRRELRTLSSVLAPRPGAPSSVLVPSSDARSPY